MRFNAMQTSVQLTRMNPSSSSFGSADPATSLGPGFFFFFSFFWVGSVVGSGSVSTAGVGTGFFLGRFFGWNCSSFIVWGKPPFSSTCVGTSASGSDSSTGSSSGSGSGSGAGSKSMAASNLPSSIVLVSLFCAFGFLRMETSEVLAKHSGSKFWTWVRRVPMSTLITNCRNVFSSGASFFLKVISAKYSTHMLYRGSGMPALNLVSFSVSFIVTRLSG
mmetsp:Transcript_12585/g.30050  ORF Transcript_12585/g.30050 Transcript_12585/m.30050 type:complete len:219 (-) Transcript_12585:871-1527(-)